MTPAEEDHLATVVATAVAQSIKTNGNGVPKNWTELVWKSAMSFGVPTLVLGVIVLIVYQTAPAYIESNIATQKSLTNNLDKQTENLDKQTINLDKASDTLDKLTQNVDEIKDWDTPAAIEFQNSVREEHQAAMDDHREQMTLLVEIGKNQKE